MTVAEIQEYIDKITSEIYSAYYNNWGEISYGEEEVKEICDKGNEIIKWLDELQSEDAEYICETQRGLKDLDE